MVIKGRTAFLGGLAFTRTGVSAGQLTRDNGKTARGMAWAWRRAAVGSTGENGRRDSRVVTGSGSPPPPRRDTRARGPAACRTATAPRPTPTAVSGSSLVKKEQKEVERKAG